MLTEYGVLKPDVPRAGYAEESYELWRQPRRLREEREWEEFFALWREHPIPHDPLWAYRLMSIQCVRGSMSEFDASLPAHWAWATVGYLLRAGVAAWMLGACAMAVGYRLF